MSSPTTDPVYQVTLGWIDASPDETITEAIVKVEKEHGIRLYRFGPDPFNGPGYWDVTFRGSHEGLRALLLSPDGGECDDTDMIVQVFL